MKIIECRNAHQALPLAVNLLKRYGVKRDSRNGPVILITEPVTVAYEKSCERVLFWPERDANPFFHLYESLWMIAGRNDVAGPARYAGNIKNYSDDGQTLHGAYGYRWRRHFNIDQLSIIANTLQANPDDRRCVLQMWDVNVDLGETKKDHPCNTIATFSRNIDGALDLTVFQRSGDVVWGVIGANVVHFSMLHEYMANWIDCPVGQYHQVVTNFHSYLSTFQQVETLSVNALNPYTHKVIPTSLPKDHGICDQMVKDLLFAADNGFENAHHDESFWDITLALFRAHHVWKSTKFKEKALEILARENQKADWIVAATEWMQRRAK